MFLIGHFLSYLCYLLIFQFYEMTYKSLYTRASPAVTGIHKGAASLHGYPIKPYVKV